PAPATLLPFPTPRSSDLAAFVLGALVGFGAVLADPRRAPDLVPKQFFTGSARERVERLEKEKERIETVEDAADFASSLYTHNIEDRKSTRLNSSHEWISY